MNKALNKIQRVLADTTMLLVLFGLLIIPISSVGLLKYNAPSQNQDESAMQVLSKHDERPLKVNELKESTESTESTLPVKPYAGY